MIKIDDTYKPINAYMRGRKEKLWLEKDNQKYLYKFGANNYEILAELLAEQLGKQVGIDMAAYHVASYKNTIGVLTKNFVKSGELIISSDKLKAAVQDLYEENNLHGNLQENTILNLVQAAFTYDATIDTSQLFDELVKRWLFTGLIMESDKNATNISFIKTGNKLRLSPDYDNSTMCRLNENITNLMTNIKDNTDIYKLTDGIKQALKPSDSSSDYFLESLQEFSNKYPNKVKTIFLSFKNIDVDSAITIVETTNNIKVPWEVSYFINKAISLRYNDMENIVTKTKSINK